MQGHCLEDDCNDHDDLSLDKQANSEPPKKGGF